MRFPRCILALGLATLLLPGFPVPPANASASEPISLLGVSRSGDNVTVEASSDSFLYDVFVSLLESNVRVALPEHRMDHWFTDARHKFEFTLQKDVDSATVTIRWRADAQDRSQSIGIVVPPKAAPAEVEGDPLVIVEAARLSGTLLEVNLSNVGDAGTGRLLVSLEDASKRKIGAPYYRALTGLAAGRTASTTFTLANTVESVVVALEYANRTERVDVAVQKAQADGTTDAEATGPVNVSLATDLPFREVDIGRTVDFAIQVKNHGRPSLVQLSAEGLPSGYSARFFVGGSAVPSLYLAGNQSRVVTMSVTVPNSADEVDRTIDFETLALVNASAHARLQMGIAVRGVGKLEMSGEALFATVPPGGTGTFTLLVKNTGTAPLFDVDLDGRNRPYGWTIRFEPRRLDRLDPGASEAVRVEVRAPDVIGPGRYVTDVAARSGDASSLAMAIQVEVPATEPGGGWLGYVFVAAIAGILGFAAWRKRRG